MTNPRCYRVILIAVASLLFWSSPGRSLELVADGQWQVDVVVDVATAQGKNEAVIRDAGDWLVESLQRASGASAADLRAEAQGPAVILGLASAYEDVAKAAGLNTDHPDAFAIITESDRVYVLGNSAYAVSHGVATLLHDLGFRWYGASAKWWVTPKATSISVDLNTVESPAMRGRKIWYAYGVGGDATLGANYQRWAIANRLMQAAPLHTGHSYGHIIGRNTEAFEAHPEYFALLENGERDTKRGFNARKFCVSNPGLIELVVADRIKLLESRRATNPYEFMVSVDPSDGQGTCHCENCVALGTTTDRVFHLANHVARGLRAKYPDAWVGLYAYSSHRLPPTIEVEPNVYVQVAMGFNRTQYSLPELVTAWSQKVSSLGLREYYGVEAWDWGLPGRMRGGQVDYHRKWIPYFANRNVNAVNAETNANWGGQTLGLYVAAQLMWDPSADVDAMVDEYFEKMFGNAASAMRKLQAQFDATPQIKPFALKPVFAQLNDAYELADDDVV